MKIKTHMNKKPLVIGCSLGAALWFAAAYTVVTPVRHYVNQGVVKVWKHLTP